MELIWLTPDLREIGPAYNDIDFDVGVPDQSTNDFLMTGDIPDNAGALYVPGTEFGGLIEYKQTKNTDSLIKTKGWTWRGLLTQGIICPESGQNYYTASGDAHAIIRNLLSGFLGGLFTVPEATSGIAIPSYQYASGWHHGHARHGRCKTADSRPKAVFRHPRAGSCYGRPGRNDWRQIHTGLSSVADTYSRRHGSQSLDMSWTGRACREDADRSVHR